MNIFVFDIETVPDVEGGRRLYLRFQLMRGQLQEAEYRRECQLLRDVLTTENKPHFDEFLQAWGL